MSNIKKFKECMSLADEYLSLSDGSPKGYHFSFEMGHYTKRSYILISHFATGETKHFMFNKESDVKEAVNFLKSLIKEYEDS